MCGFRGRGQQNPPTPARSESRPENFQERCAKGGRKVAMSAPGGMGEPVLGGPLAPRAGERFRIMSLLPQGASFEELVQDYFLAVRGAGLMLSALDTELLTSWAREGVPYEVVARGITRAGEKALYDARPGEPVLRSLRACKRQVDAEIKKYRTRSAGGGEEAAPKRKTRTWEETRHARLRESLEGLAAAEAGLAGRVRHLLDTVLAEVPVEPAKLDAQEGRVFLALLRALPFPERVALWRQAVRDAADTGGMSPHSRRIGRRFRVLARVRWRLGLQEV